MEKHVVIGMSDEYETAAIYPTNGRDRGGGGIEKHEFREGRNAFL